MMSDMTIQRTEWSGLKRGADQLSVCSFNTLRKNYKFNGTVLLYMMKKRHEQKQTTKLSWEKLEICFGHAKYFWRGPIQCV